MMLLAAMTRDAVRRLALVLQHGVERHREQAAGHGDADEVGEDAPAARRPQERRDAGEAGVAGRPRAGGVQIDREERHRSAATGTKRALTSPCSSRSASIEPRPTPTANSASISVTTCSLANSTSLANTGSPDTTVAPNSQNHEIASIGSSSAGRARHVPDDGDRVVEQAAAAADRRRRRRRRRDQARARSSRSTRADDADAADDQRAVAEQHDAAAEDRAEQDREEGAGLDQRVAGDELVVAQVLRQQRVLDRPEHRRVRAEAEERRKQQRHAAASHRPQRAERHDADLGDLHPAGDDAPCRRDRRACPTRPRTGRTAR